MTVGGCDSTAGMMVSHASTRVIPYTPNLALLSAFFLFLFVLSASLFTPAKAQDAKPGVVGLGDLVDVICP